MLQSFSEAYNVRGKEQVNRNCYPKSTSAVKKQPLKRFSEIAEWQENEKLVLEPCVFTTEKSCVQRSYTVIANITASSNQQSVGSPLFQIGGLFCFEPSDWSKEYLDPLLGEIGNILEQGSGVVGSLRRGLGCLRKEVGIMLMRDDVMR